VAYRQVTAADGIGWDIHLHVARAHRRRGIGSRLIAALTERARACRLRAMFATLDDPEPGAMEFLARMGFHLLGRETRYELDLDGFARALMPLRQRLIQRGKVPATVRVMTLAEAPRQEVSRFYAEERVGSGEDAETHWPAAWDKASVREVSFVLMDGSRVIGLGLGEMSASTMVGRYRLVGAEHRGGWANLVMCAEAASMLAGRGIRHAEFITTTRTLDAQAIANLYGARPVQSRHRYLLPLTKRPRTNG
jgi:hypothetical protein